jgi:uncharacterized membrane protein
VRVVGVVAIAVVVFGVVARFTELGRLFYFHDEATTSLRVSGRTDADVERAVAGRWLTARDLSAFQRPSGRSLVDSIHSLAVDDPQHPPLYFGLARLWPDVAGSSPAALRALSAAIGTIAFAAVGWLAWELFAGALTVLLAVALFAVSPFQILYAQQAREYALWTLLTAAASAALLAALRTRGRRMWGLYALLLTASLYTFPNAVLVAAAHGIYVAARERRALFRFAVCAAAAVVLFVPWLGVIVLERGAFEAGTSWTSEAIPFAELVKSWIVTAAVPLVDVSSLSGGDLALGGAAVALEVAALVIVWRAAARSAALFVLLLVLVPVLPLAIADAATGGIRSTIPRYLAPTMLGLSLALAFALARGLAAVRPAPRLAAGLASGLVVAAGVASYAHRLDARVWWTADDGAAATSLAVSRTLDAHPRSVLVATGPGTVLELSHYLRPSTRIYVALDGRLPSLPRDADAVYLYGSPANGSAAARLRALVADARRRGRHVEAVPLSLPCCSADIAHIPGQFWRA